MGIYTGIAIELLSPALLSDSLFSLPVTPRRSKKKRRGRIERGLANQHCADQKPAICYARASAPNSIYHTFISGVSGLTARRMVVHF